MTNEEKAKAKEIAQSVSFFWTNEDDIEKSIIDTVSLRKAIFNAALQAMQWKDEQFAKEKQEWTDKATEWLRHNIYDYFYWIEMEGESEANIKDTLFDDFKKATKG